MAPAPPEHRGLRRLSAAWGNLAREQRMVVIAAGVLLLTMLLPWYSLDAFASVKGTLVKTTSAKRAITVFSFVEAAIFLVALGVVLLVLARGDRRAFHLPGGDGTVVTAAGAWVTFLVFYRFVDKPGKDVPGAVRLEYGLSWGIFFGLLAALALLAAGLRLRAAQVSEPALPGDTAPSDDPVVPRPPVPVATPDAFEDDTRAARRREREERRRAGRASAETPVRERRPASPLPPAVPRDEAPTRPAPAEERPTRHDDPEPEAARAPDADPDDAATRHLPADEAPTRLFEPPPAFEPPERDGA